MIKYGIGWGYDSISEYEVVSEAEKTLVVCDPQGRTRRCKKISHYCRFFDTLHEAQQHLLKRARDKVKSATKELEQAEDQSTKLQEKFGA